MRTLEVGISDEKTHHQFIHFMIEFLARKLPESQGKVRALSTASEVATVATKRCTL